MTEVQACSRPVCNESALLFTFCMLDMLSSVVLFQCGLAVEANPVLRPYAEAGLGPFVVAKSVSFLPAIVYLEWLRRRRPRFATALLRCAAISYAVIYLVPAVAQLLL